MSDINNSINELKALITLLNSIKEGFVDINDANKVSDLFSKLSSIDFKNTKKLNSDFSQIAGLVDYINKTLTKTNKLNKTDLENLIDSHDSWEKIRDIIYEVYDNQIGLNTELSESNDLTDDLVENLFNLKRQLNKTNLNNLLSTNSFDSFRDNIDGIIAASRDIGDVFDLNPFESMDTDNINMDNLLNNLDKPSIDINGVNINTSDAIVEMDKILDHSQQLKHKLLKLRFDQIFDNLITTKTLNLNVDDSGMIDKLIDSMAGLVDLTAEETANVDKLLSKMSIEQKYLLANESSLRRQNQISVSTYESNKKLLSVLNEFRPLYLYLNDMGQGIVDGFEEGLSILPGWLQKLTGMDIAAEKMRESLTASLQSSITILKETGSASQALTGFVSNFSKGIASAINPLVLFIGAITLLTSALVLVNNKVNDISTSLGVSRNNAFEIYKLSTDLITSSDNIYVNQERINSLMVAHKNLYGTILDLSDKTNTKMIKTLSAISSQYNVSMDNVYGMVSAIQGAGADKELATNLASWAAQASNLAGISFDNIVTDLKENSEVIAKYYHNLPKDAVRAAVEFRRMGMSLKNVAGLMDATFDPDNTLKNAAELSVMTDGITDLQKVFNMNLEGADPKDVMKETTRQFDDLLNSGKANRFNMEQFAQSFGVPLDELQKGYQFRKIQYKLDGKERDLVEKHMAKMSEEDLKNSSLSLEKATGFENMEKLQQSWEKIKTTIGTAIIPLVEALADSLDSVLPIVGGITSAFKILSGIAKILKPVFLGMLLPFTLLLDTITWIGSKIKKYILEPIGLLKGPLSEASGLINAMKIGLQSIGFIIGTVLLSKLPLIGGIFKLPLKLLSLFKLNIVDIGKTLVNQFGDKGKSIFSGLLGKLGPLGDKLKGLFNNKTTSTPADTIADGIDNASNKTNIFKRLLESLKSGSSNLGDLIKKIFNGIGDILVNLFDKLKVIIRNISSTFKDLFTDIISIIKDSITNVSKLIKDVLVNISSGLGTAFKNIMNSMTSVGSLIKSLLVNISSGIGSFVTNISKSIGNLIQIITKQVGKGVEVILKGISRGLESFSTKSIKGAVAITIVSASLWLLSKAIGSFSNIEWSDMGKAAASLAGVTAIALILGNISGKAIIGALSIAVLGAALIPLGYALNMFTGLDWSTLAKAGVALLGLTLIVAGLGAIMTSGVGAVAILAGSAAIAIMGVALIPLAYSLGLVSDSLAKLDDINGSNLFSVAKGIIALGAALVAFSIGSFANTITSLFSSDPTKKLKKLAELSNPIKTLADSIQSLVNNLTSLPNALNNLDVNKLNKISINKNTAAQLTSQFKSNQVTGVNNVPTNINTINPIKHIPTTTPETVTNQINSIKNQPSTTTPLQTYNNAQTNNIELLSSIKTLTSAIQGLNKRPIIVKLGDQDLKTLNRNLKKYNNY